MTPEILIKEIKASGIGNDEIAKRIGCSSAYVVKLANGSRNQPSYSLMDKLRELHSELCR